MAKDEMLPENLEFTRDFSDEVNERTYLTPGVREWVCVGVRRAIGKAPMKSFQLFPIFHPLRTAGDPKSMDKSHQMRQFIGVPLLNPDADEPENAADLISRKKKLGNYQKMGTQFLRKLLGTEMVPEGWRKDSETEEWTFGGEPVDEDLSKEDRQEMSKKHNYEMGQLLVKLWNNEEFRKELKGYTIYAKTDYNADGYLNIIKAWPGDEPPEDEELVEAENWETTELVPEGDEDDE